MGEELATWQISKIRLSKQSHHWMGFLLNKFLQWLVLLCLQPAGVFLSGFSKHQQPHAYESGSVKIMSTLEHLCKLFLKIFLSLKTFLTCSLKVFADYRYGRTKSLRGTKDDADDVGVALATHKSLGKVERILREGVLIHPEAKLHKWESLPFRSAHLSLMTAEASWQMSWNFADF